MRDHGPQTKDHEEKTTDHRPLTAIKCDTRYYFNLFQLIILM